MKEVDGAIFIFCVYLISFINAGTDHIPRNSSRFRTKILESGDRTSAISGYSSLREIDFNHTKWTLKMLEDALVNALVTPNPSDMYLQIPSPITSNQPTPSSFVKDVDSSFSSPKIYSAEELVKSLSNHHITVGNCIENNIAPDVCKDMIELSNVYYELKFEFNQRYSVASMMRPRNLEFDLNTVGLTDLWKNHINRDNKLSLDIVESNYDELIYYHEPPIDPHFVVPKMSVYNYDEITYGVNRAGPVDYSSKLLTKSSNLRPKFVVHAPQGYSTDFLLNAMTGGGFSYPRQSAAQMMDDSEPEKVANLPFGQKIDDDETILDTYDEEDLFYSYKEPDRPYINKQFEINDSGPPPTSEAAETQDYFSEAFIPSPLVERFSQPELFYKDKLKHFKDDTKIVVRLKTGSSGKTQEIEIPSSKIDENGMSELKLKDGRILRIRIKKKKHTSPGTINEMVAENSNRPPVYNTRPNSNGISMGNVKNKIHSILKSVQGMTKGMSHNLEGNMNSAYGSADTFLTDMFGGVDTAAYYENVLTMVAIASFVSFLYARGIIIFNNLSPLIARTEAWWTAIKKREDVDGVASVVVLIQEAIKMWSAEDIVVDKTDLWIPLETKTKPPLLLAPHNPYRISKRILNVSNYSVTEAPSSFPENTTIVNQLDEISKIGALMIDAALELRVKKENADGTSCLAKPLCELNKRTNEKALKALLIPILSTFAQWVVVEPNDPFSTLEVLRPLWLSQDDQEPCERILKCSNDLHHKNISFLP